MQHKIVCNAMRLAIIYVKKVSSENAPSSTLTVKHPTVIKSMAG